MSKLVELERQIQALGPEEWRELREWFAEQDAVKWDRQFEEDVMAGKLDALGAAARKARAEGKSTLL